MRGGDEFPPVWFPLIARYNVLVPDNQCLRLSARSIKGSMRERCGCVLSVPLGSYWGLIKLTKLRLDYRLSGTA